MMPSFLPGDICCEKCIIANSYVRCRGFLRGLSTGEMQAGKQVGFAVKSRGFRLFESLSWGPGFGRIVQGQSDG